MRKFNGSIIRLSSSVICMKDKDKPIVAPKLSPNAAYKIGDVTVRPDPNNYRRIIQKKDTDTTG
jgi:hypothetical protein